MQLVFKNSGAEASVLLTDAQNASPEGRRHAEVSGSSNSEENARALAQEIIEVLTKSRSMRWRVPFEYKQERQVWRLYSRFSFLLDAK